MKEKRERNSDEDNQFTGSELSEGDTSGDVNDAMSEEDERHRTLQRFRDEIDRVDTQMVEFLKARFKLSIAVGNTKKASKSEVLPRTKSPNDTVDSSHQIHFPHAFLAYPLHLLKT